MIETIVISMVTVYGTFLVLGILGMYNQKQEQKLKVAKEKEEELAREMRLNDPVYRNEAIKNCLESLPKEARDRIMRIPMK